MGNKWFSTGLALPWLAFLLSCAPGKAPPPLRDLALAPGVEVGVELRGGELHAYPAELARGEGVVLAVTQDQIDVIVELFDPRGVSVLLVDGPNGPSGPEPLAVVAERGGVHWLEIRAPSRGAGSYRLRVEALGPATENTREYAAALRLYAAAERLRREQDGAALRQALVLYRDALAKLEGLTEAPAEPEHLALWTARTTRRVGQMLDALGELQEALGVYERALAAYRELGAEFEITPLLNSAGHAYRQLGEPVRARQAFERALEISRSLDNRIGEGTALNNLGVLSEALGETQAALDFYRQALAIWRQLGRAAYEATTLHNLGVSHLSLGRLDEGLVFLEQALALLREHDNRRDLAITLTAIGWAHQGDGRPDEALAAYDEAIELARGVEDRQNQAVTLNLRGDVYREQGAWEAARASYEEALALLEGTGEGINEAHLLTQLGRVEEEGGQLGAARSLHERALDLFRRAGNLNGEATALLGLARTARLEGDPATALARAEEAMDLVESRRFRLQSLAFRSSYFASRFDDHCFYVDLLMELGQAERAFEARERARARSLSESLAEARVDVAGHAAPELLKRERALRRTINAKEHLRLRLHGDGPAAAKVDVELNALLLDYETVRGEIRVSGLRRVGAVEPEAPSVEEIRNLLDDDTHLLAFSLGASRSFLWWVSREGFRGFELPPRKTLEALARRLHQGLPRKDQSLGQQTELDRRELSRMLLGQVEPLLDAERLVVLADGALHPIPFGVLSRPSTPERFLVEDHEIISLASTTVLELLREGRPARELPPTVAPKARPMTVAVVADPVFQADDPRLSGSEASGEASATLASSRDLDRAVRDFEIESFSRLLHSGREAAAILALLPSEQRFLALGFDATREVVLGGELASYSIVHFATHGLLNDRHPALSGLVFSLVDARGRPRDGFLRVHEIPSLRLDAELVVLSACRTALGREVRGEGLVGLPQGFFATGASQVIVSAWNVNDQATAELMVRFYRGLVEDGLSASQALREAQRSMLEEEQWRAPYFWAAFMLQGDWR